MKLVHQFVLSVPLGITVGKVLQSLQSAQLELIVLRAQKFVKHALLVSFA